MLDIFGDGNFYLELQDQGLEEEARILPDMKRLHAETGIPFVATNDVSLRAAGGCGGSRYPLCIQTATTIDEENRMRFPNDQFYLKSEDEMRKIFASIPEACDNTEKIAQQCDVTFTSGSLICRISSAGRHDATASICGSFAQKGLEERYRMLREKSWPACRSDSNTNYRRLKIWVMWNTSLSSGISSTTRRKITIMVGPGRGSAAGSIVAYILKITDIDPIRYNLIFERFLNPERVSMPDIDIDFCYERRAEVIDYVTRKYGEDKVSQIITFGTMKAKAAVRDVGRVLNVSYRGNRRHRQGHSL